MLANRVPADHPAACPATIKAIPRTNASKASRLRGTGSAPVNASVVAAGVVTAGVVTIGVATIGVATIGALSTPSTARGGATGPPLARRASPRP